MKQLVYMFSYISHKTPEESEKIILETQMGKAVKTGNVTALYEQETENLAEIAEELSQTEAYQNIAGLFSVSKIVDAADQLSLWEEQQLLPDDYRLCFKKNGELKKKRSAELRASEKKKLQMGRQNQLNVRRIEYADKIKEQK